MDQTGGSETEKTKKNRGQFRILRENILSEMKLR